MSKASPDGTHANTSPSGAYEAAPRSPLASAPAPLDRSSHEIRSYETLDGGSGKSVFFRPDRYARAELGSVGVAVEFEHEGRAVSCDLYDVSQNGVGFHWGEDEPPPLGTELLLSVRFDQFEAYHGKAKVSSARRIDGALVVGVSLLDTLMNIDDVLHLRDVKSWATDASSEGLGLKDATWHIAGHDRFKSLIGELRLLLEDGQARLSELERSLPPHVLHGDQRSPAYLALAERITQTFSADIIQLSNEINTTVQGASRDEREALREFSLRHIHSFLMESPCMHRARHKPLGYPGDYEVMNYIYGNLFTGHNLFARAVNYAFVGTPAPQAVRTRKDLMKRELSRILDEASPTRTLRVLSVAAGPAQELYELLSERATLNGPVEVVLFEQDRRALSFSHARLSQLIQFRWAGEVRLVPLHDSIKRLLQGAALLRDQTAFDVVYAAGLFDYLQDHTWVSLCRNLFSITGPEGSVYIGNMTPQNPSRWVMEFHLDWPLVYREPDHLLTLAGKVSGTGESRILEEKTGVNPFVLMRRH